MNQLENLIIQCQSDINKSNNITTEIIISLGKFKDTDLILDVCQDNEFILKLIDKLNIKFPNIRSKIKSYYTSTPLSFRDYIGSPDGSLYGVRKDYKNPLKTYLSPKTKVPNLFLTRLAPWT